MTNLMNKPSSLKRHRASLYLDAELKEKLKARAKAERRTVSDYLYCLVEETCNNEVKAK
jgi:hypothetical protein